MATDAVQEWVWRRKWGPSEEKPNSWRPPTCAGLGNELLKALEGDREEALRNARTQGRSAAEVQRLFGKADGLDMAITTVLDELAYLRWYAAGTKHYLNRPPLSLPDWPA